MHVVQADLGNILLVGAGWLGEPFALQLKAAGYKIVVTARQADRINALQATGLSCWRLDMEDVGESLGLSSRLLSFQTIIWAVPPGNSSAHNYALQITRLLKHWPSMRGRKLIFYSSTGIYPNLAGNWNENSPIQTDHRIAEAEKVAQLWGGDVLILRCGGLCDERRVVGRHFSAKILYNSNQPVNYIHRDDVIAASHHLLSKEATGIFNLVAPQHPERITVFKAQANRYGFAPPAEHQTGGINRLISVDKLLESGYCFIHPDPILF